MLFSSYATGCEIGHWVYNKRFGAEMQIKETAERGINRKGLVWYRYFKANPEDRPMGSLIKKQRDRAAGRLPAIALKVISGSQHDAGTFPVDFIEQGFGRTAGRQKFPVCAGIGRPVLVAGGDR